MIAYVDSSIVLRLVLGQRSALREWKDVEVGVASALVEVECFRTLDRFRLVERIGDDEVVVRRQAVYRLLETLEIVEPSPAVLRRAAQPLPTVLGTLDALHLATALLWRESTGSELVMATHDAGLAAAARATGLQTVGI